MSTRKKAIPVNQKLREQLKKHDQGVMEESNQNLLRRSSVSSSASTSSIESRTSLNQPKPEVTSIQASSQLESREYFRDKKNQVEAEKNNSEKQKEQDNEVQEEQDNEVQEEQDNEVHEEPDNEVLTNTNIIEEHSQYKENQEPFGDNSNQASNKKKGKKKLKRAIGSNLKDDHANKKQKNDQRRSRRLATSHWIQKCPEIPTEFQEYCIRCWRRGHSSKECKYKGKPPVPPWMNDQEYQLFLEKRLKNESQQNPQED
ncbi:unnamed protein product [Rhizophagus irregularis]|uniref:Uncharacterized protein n=1 Tax=Rhizophagus irregularis TaxID=588596 RepID=A0A915ZAJ9_9GLOM|nr:unnamed protein product [Rhizophagus irregularis]